MNLEHHSDAYGNSDLLPEKAEYIIDVVGQG